MSRYSVNSSGDNSNPTTPLSALRVFRNGMTAITVAGLPPIIYSINRYIPAPLGTQVGFGFALLAPGAFISGTWTFAYRMGFHDRTPDTLGNQIRSTMFPAGVTPFFTIVIMSAILWAHNHLTSSQLNTYLTPLILFASTFAYILIGAGIGAGFYGLDHRREIGRSCRSRNRGENAPLVHGEIVGNEIVANSEQAPLPSDSSLRQKMTSLFASCTRKPSQVDEQNSDIEASGTPQNYQSTPGNV